MSVSRRKMRGDGQAPMLTTWTRRLRGSAVWSGVGTVILLKVIEFMVPLRVSKQSEIEGLDVTQHGEALQ